MKPLACWLAYIATLPIRVVGLLAYLLGIALRCVTALFQLGWNEGENFTDWIFDVKPANSQAGAEQ